MKTSDRPRAAFSLVEVVLALGIMAGCLLSLVALLLVGIKSNQASAEEMRAVNLLTVLEADLRNTHPAANNGKSRFFGLVLPYATNSSGFTVYNPALTVNTVSTATSTGLDENENPLPYTSLAPRPRCQASVIYTSVPAAGSFTPVQARLIVNWPATNASTPQALITMSSGSFVEVNVTFPAP
ncbi:MAG: type II secretion system protein J [Candidatus Methylacidiphilales bacterium]|nr:hypothetical protein [Candidatus Methylacidiphilales bacterium]